MHGTSHQCKFLPKFHPELNSIERVWSRLKWYLRKYNDGKLATLQLLYKLHFPYGVDKDEHINDDELALHDNMIEYMNDNVTHDDELDTWLNMLDNYQRSGRII
jgi:hypothetical protein